MTFHKDLGDLQIHRINDKVYADIAARDADAAWNTAAGNVGKVVLVTATQQVFMLQSVTPSWFEFGGVATLVDTIFTADGDVAGDREITAPRGRKLEFKSYDLLAGTFTLGADIDIQNGEVDIEAFTGDGAGGTSAISRILINTATMQVLDQINSMGLVYAADYSANFSSRSLIDKDYHDNNSFFSKDGDVTGNRRIGAPNGFSLNLTSYDLTATNYTVGADIEVDGNEAIVQAMIGDGLGGMLTVSRILINSVNMLVTDTTNSKGLIYGGDYSAAFTDRSLVDKAWVEAGKLLVQNASVRFDNSAAPFMGGIYADHSIYVADNQYLDHGDATLKATTTGSSNLFELEYNIGFQFFSALSATQDTAVTNVEVMRLHSMGGLALGSGVAATNPGIGKLLVEDGIAIGSLTTPAHLLHVSSDTVGEGRAILEETAATGLNNPGLELRNEGVFKGGLFYHEDNDQVELFGPISAVLTIDSGHEVSINGKVASRVGDDITEVFTAADLPTAVAGVITLPSGTYKFMENLTLSDRLEFPALATIDLDFESAPVTKLTYSGTGTFMSGSPARVSIHDGSIECTGNGATLFDLTGCYVTVEKTRLEMSGTTGTLGTITSSPAAVLRNGTLTGFTGGLTIESPVLVNIVQMANTPSLSSTDATLKFTGSPTIGGLVNMMAAVAAPGGSLFYVEPGHWDVVLNITNVNNAGPGDFFQASAAGGQIGAVADAGGGEITVTTDGHTLSADDGVNITGTDSYNGTYVVQSINGDDFNVIATFVATEVGLFNTGSQDQTHLYVNAQNNGAQENSRTLGSLFWNGNTTDSTVASGAYGVIATGGAELDSASEQFTLLNAATGEMTYNGLFIFNGMLMATLHTELSPPTADYRFAISINQATPVYATAQHWTTSLKSEGDRISIMVPITLNPGDDVRLMIAGIGTTAAIALLEGVIAIQ